MTDRPNRTADRPALVPRPMAPSAALDRVRAAVPLVHNITNHVVMQTTANALLAIGASPAMVQQAPTRWRRSPPWPARWSSMSGRSRATGWRQ